MPLEWSSKKKQCEMEKKQNKTKQNDTKLRFVARDKKWGVVFFSPLIGFSSHDDIAVRD